MLDSLAVFAGVGDVLRGSPAPEVSLELAGPFARDLPAGADNLVVRAARSLGAPRGSSRGARLVLTKNLPVASGIGGGSADAAAALRLVSRLWGIEADLPGVAASLGADVPMCLGSRAVRMRGIGECLDPAPQLPKFGILLANAGVPVQTADVFRARRGPFSAAADLPEAWADAVQMAGDLSKLRNDLEAAAIGLCPVIGSVLAAIGELRSCLLARMSGSGGTCFGLFASAQEAAHAATLLAGRGWWVWGGAVREVSG